MCLLYYQILTYLWHMLWKCLRLERSNRNHRLSEKNLLSKSTSFAFETAICNLFISRSQKECQMFLKASSQYFSQNLLPISPHFFPNVTFLCLLKTEKLTVFNVFGGYRIVTLGANGLLTFLIHCKVTWKGKSNAVQSTVCGSLHNLVPFVQSQKREKHP